MDGEDREERQKALFDRIWDAYPDPICLASMIFDAGDTPVDYLILDINPAYVKEMGFARQHAIGRRVTELFPFHDPDWIAKCGFAVCTGQVLNTSEYNFGTGWWYDVQVIPLNNDNQFITIARDVTLRKKAEERTRIQNIALDKQVRERTRELEMANRFIDNILESIKDPFFTLDHGWCFTYANKAARLQSPQGELIGQNIWTLFPRMIGSEYWDVYHEVMEKKTPRCCEAQTAYKGYWFLVSVYPLEDGISVLQRDITERKQAEIELRQSEQRFQQMFNHSPDMVVIVSMADHRYIDVNQKFCEILGYRREELIGRTPIEMSVIANEEHDIEQFSQVLEEERELHNLEVRLRTRSGATIHTLSSSSLITLGGQSHRLTVMKDVTRDKQIELELARLDRLNLVGEMAASIGHEIRNPMTAVRGFLQMLGEKEQYADDQVFFDIMIEEMDRANAIISEYLGMAGNKSIDLQAHSLDQLITWIYPIIQSEANLKDMSIRLELNQPPEIMVDKSEIIQLVLNMTRNAMDAMLPHGTVTISTSQVGDEAVLSIQDQGSGLSAEIIDHIGTPFLTTKSDGTGLGLAVCYSIAARHQSSIDFKTGPAGTTFYVHFPLYSQGETKYMGKIGRGGAI